MKQGTILILLISLSQIVTAATIYVNKAVIGGAGDGASWANAYTNLQDAIDAASAGDEIWVVTGTYVPTKDQSGVANANNRDNTFYITKNIKIYGGFVGTETLLSQRDVTTNVTILSGDMDNDGVKTDNAYIVMYIDGTSANGNITNAMILDGFTIQLGYNDHASNNDGGGLYLNGSGAGKICSPTISNCFFSNNHANDKGGAILSDAISGTCKPILTQCFFSDNSATDGGAFFNDAYIGESSPTFNNCIFTNNSASDDGGAIYNKASGNGKSNPIFITCSFTNNTSSSDGGCMYNYADNGTSSPVFSNCTFNKNSATADCGAICNDGNNGGVSSPTFTSCRFEENTASGEGGGVYNYADNGTSSPIFTSCTFYKNSAHDGGAIINDARNGGTSNPTLNTCTFNENTATDDGGGVYNYGNGGTVTPIFNACTFKNNSASDDGGALFNDGLNSGNTNTSFTNCLFFGNSAEEGGAFLNDGRTGNTTVTVTNCTFYNHSATISASDLIYNWGSSITLTIKNSIFWDGTNLENNGNATTFNYCIFDDGTENGLVTLPSGASGSNNLDSDPLFTDKDNNDFSLTNASPAKNAGTNAGAPSTDITGANRTDGATDIGAYEIGAVLPVELVFFKGEIHHPKVALKWQTASEKDNYGFEIERSQDGKNWATIGFVLGQGNAHQINDYYFFDEQPQVGTNYYRLKQNDLKNSFEYSNIINLQFLSAKDKLHIYPNLVNDFLTIENGQGIGLIYNMSGQLIQQLNINQQTYTTATSSLQQGQYILVIQSNDRIEKKRFIKL